MGKERRRKAWALLVLLHCLFVSPVLPGAAPGRASAAALKEYDIKAGFIYQFAQFVEWPENAHPGSGSFIFCVVGENPFGGVMESIEGALIQGKPVRVEHHENWKSADVCHVIFISSSVEDETGRIVSKYSGKPVLTISETPGFIEKGGIINFVREGGKIRFEINQKSAESAGLEISSKLLSLAKKVIPQDNLP